MHETRRPAHFEMRRSAASTAYCIMHDQAHEFVRRALRRIPRPHRVVECGSRIINGTVRGLFAGCEYIGIDLVAGPGVDVVGDFARWGEPGCCDLVICCEVIEHCEDGCSLCARARMLLAAGGALIVTAASMRRAPHSVTGGALPSGEHYAGIALSTLSRCLRSYDLVQLEESDLDVRALAIVAAGCGSSRMFTASIPPRRQSR